MRRASCKRLTDNRTSPLTTGPTHCFNSCKRLTDNRTSPRKFQTKLVAHPGKRKDSLGRNSLRVPRNPGEKRCPTASSVRGKPADLLVASRGRFFRLACRAKYSGEPQMGQGAH